MACNTETARVRRGGGGGGGGSTLCIIPPKHSSKYAQPRLRNSYVSHATLLPPPSSPSPASPRGLREDEASRGRRLHPPWVKTLIKTSLVKLFMFQTRA
ncbi:hypothetical protein E2C01_093913 [Portunus trituberculatus]|uniref:Uncharacterized protein n=1 Tax=Portunus trituberculatus TaxID=210409 RepID=A0A5B7JUR9_PORTR|nr:hypothetical protein [Portunus trituberculatus]